MVEVFKYLKGYVRIRVTGFSPERFMNLCSNHNLLLWNIEKSDGAYLMNISLFVFYKLRPIVKKTGTRVAIQKRYGLPFFMQKVKKRKIFCIGFFLAVAFWVWTSSFIWEIEFEGNHEITEDVLLSFLEEKQVKTGMAKKKLEIEEIEDSLRKEYTNITWVSVKLNGAKLTISLKENEVSIKKEKSDELGADIVLEHSIKYEVPLLLDYKNIFFNFRGKQYTLGSKKVAFRYFDTVVEEEQIQILKILYLPIDFGTKIYREYYWEEKNIQNRRQRIF